MSNKTVEGGLHLKGTALIVDKEAYTTHGGISVTKFLLLDPSFRPQPFSVSGSNRVAKRWNENFNLHDVVQYSIDQELAEFDNGMTNHMVMDRTTLKIAQ